MSKGTDVPYHGFPLVARVKFWIIPLEEDAQVLCPVHFGYSVPHEDS